MAQGPAQNRPDVIDRVGRLLGVVASITAVVHVDDNAGSLTVDSAQLPAALVGGRLDVNIGAGTVTTNPPANASENIAQINGVTPLMGNGVTGTGSPRVTIASDNTPFPMAEMRAATLVQSTTAAVNTALTSTLPAAGAGLFHYITSIQIMKLYSVVGVAAGAGVAITTTNLNALGWITEQLASAAGTVSKVVDTAFSNPLKSAVANTATTIVCPAQLQTIWRINVTYFTAA